MFIVYYIFDIDSNKYLFDVIIIVLSKMILKEIILSLKTNWNGISHVLLYITICAISYFYRSANEY